jgi:uncharacterized membrane protein
MEDRVNNIKWFSLSIIIPLLIVVLGVQSSFWLSARSSLNDIEIVYMFIAAVTGALSFSKLTISSKPKKIIFWLLYLFLMSQIIFWGSLLTACANGDCL